MADPVQQDDTGDNKGQGGQNDKADSKQSSYYYVTDEEDEDAKDGESHEDVVPGNFSRPSIPKIVI